MLDKDSQTIYGNVPVKCTIKLTANSRIKDIKAISYGVILKANVYVQEDQYGRRVSSTGGIPKKSKNDANVEHMKDGVILVQHDLLIELSDPIRAYNCSLYNNNKGGWILPGNEPFQHELEVIFPTKLLGADLPSTQVEHINGKPQSVGMLDYLLFVKIVRESSFLKRSKIDMFYQQLIYSGGTYVPPAGSSLQTVDREFSNKQPKKHLIDLETGCFKGEMNLYSGVDATVMMQRFIDNKLQIKTKLGVTMSVESPNVININKDLFVQLAITLRFDLTNFTFPGDFIAEGCSTGLGLFQLDSMSIKLIQNNGSEDEMSINSKYISVFDMKDCEYVPSGKFGTMEIPSKLLIETFGRVSIADYFGIGGNGNSERFHDHGNDVNEIDSGNMLQIGFQISDCDHIIMFPLVYKC